MLTSACTCGSSPRCGASQAKLVVIATMNYLKALSPKGVLIGLLAGYVIPFSIVKAIAWVAFASGIESVFLSPTSGLLVAVVVLIACPFFGGYLAAKHSKELPVVNAVVTTIIGITLNIQCSGDL